MTTPNLPDLHALKAALRDEMELRHGPLLGGATLVAALGLKSAAGLRQARKRGHVAVAVFTLPKRRGVFALTRDVADWLAKARAGRTTPSQGSTSTKGPPIDQP